MGAKLVIGSHKSLDHRQATQWRKQKRAEIPPKSQAQGSPGQAKVTELEHAPRLVGGGVEQVGHLHVRGSREEGHARR